MGFLHSRWHIRGTYKEIPHLQETCNFIIFLLFLYKYAIMIRNALPGGRAFPAFTRNSPLGTEP